MLGTACVPPELPTELELLLLLLVLLVVVVVVTIVEEFVGLELVELPLLLLQLSVLVVDSLPLLPDSPSTGSGGC